MRLTLIFLVISTSLFGQSTYQNPPGKMMEMNGFRMHYLEAGDSNEGPTVVLFHGAGDIALHWNLVLPKVGEFAHVVAIDQNGEGWSEHGHGASLLQQVYDSRELLKKIRPNGKFILVGHSLGGILAHQFAIQYPEITAGLVLVDATHPDVVLKVYNKEKEKLEWKRLRLNASRDIPSVKTHKVSEHDLSSFQPRRNFGDLLKDFSKEDEARFHFIYNERPWTYVKGQSYSYEAEIFQQMFEHYDELSIGDIPLTVITGGAKTPKEGDENWSSLELTNHSETLQRQFLQLSTNSRQVIATKSGHQIHLTEPALVASEIKKMIEEN